MTLDVKDEISPAERRRRRVRTTILDAAERLFAQEGEAGLSIRRIAEEIDYSPAAIYRYFESKDALVDELREAFFERVLELMAEAEASPEPFGARARKCMSGYVRAALEKPFHYAAAFSGFVANGAPIDISHPDRPKTVPEDVPVTNKRRAFEHLASMIARGQAEGQIRDDLDPARAAFCTWSACHGMSMILMHTQALPAHDPTASQAALEDLIASHADIFLRGLERAPFNSLHRAGLSGHAEPHPAPTPFTPGPSNQARSKDPARHD